LERLLFAAALAVTCTTASAADLASSEQVVATAEYDWSGFSVGAFGGGAWTQSDVSELFTPAFGGNFYAPPGRSYGIDASGFLAGGQIGYDWQRSALVLGIGGEFGTLDLDDAGEDPNIPISPFDDGKVFTSLKTDFYGAITARAGFAFDRALIYGKAGVAALHAKGSTIDTCDDDVCGVLTIHASGDDVLFGLTAGAGAEFGLTKHLSLGGEYRFYDFQSLEVSGVASNLLRYSQNVDLDAVHTARGFVNFRW
jgi:outer membrane immunogenic protein